MLKVFDVVNVKAQCFLLQQAFTCQEMSGFNHLQLMHQKAKNIIA